MKTLNKYKKRVLLISMMAFFAMNAYAQQNRIGTTEVIRLDTISIVDSQKGFEEMVSKIILFENFKYREFLNESKVSDTYYNFSNNSISEVEILKHFKKAARRSESVDEFTSYFHDRNLSFIGMLDGNEISSLYTAIRKTSFNEYLNGLEYVMGLPY